VHFRHNIISPFKRTNLVLTIGLLAFSSASAQERTVERITGVGANVSPRADETRPPLVDQAWTMNSNVKTIHTGSISNIDFTLTRDGGPVTLAASGGGRITYWSQDRYRRGRIEYSVGISLSAETHTRSLTGTGCDFELRDNGGSVVITWKSYDTTGTSIEDLDLSRTFVYEGTSLPSGTLKFSSDAAYVSSIALPLYLFSSSNYPKASGFEFVRPDNKILVHIIAPPRYEFVTDLTMPVTAYGTYKCDFRPDLHGWKFANGEAGDWPGTSVRDSLMWHKAFWGRFDYHFSPPAPLGHECVYPLEYSCGMAPWSFPDWPLFEEAFGKEQIYGGTGNVYPWEAAVKLWKAHNGLWHGSCYGFAISALYKYAFETEDLYSKSFLPDFERFINKFFIYQYGTYQIAHKHSQATVRPVETAKRIIEMFLLREKAAFSALSMLPVNDQSAHAVNPFQVCEVADSFKIGIYDNNGPGVGWTIIVLKNPNIWIDEDYPSMSKPSVPWGGVVGLSLTEPISHYQGKPCLPGLAGNLPSLAIGLPYCNLLYVSPDVDITITDRGGAGQIGYMQMQDTLLTNLHGGMPIIPVTSSRQPPMGYIFPSEGYRVELSNLRDSTVALTLIGDSTFFVYENVTADSSFASAISLTGRRLVVSNTGRSNQQFGLSSIRSTGSEERVFEVSGCQQAAVDSLTFSATPEDHLEIASAATPQLYSLDLKYNNGAQYLRFEHRNIIMAAGSRHRLAPRWESIDSTDLMILVDHNNDGGIDDTVRLANEFAGPTRVGDEHSMLPTESELLQNFPNPFNAQTSIQFRVGGTYTVQLSIYSSIGQRVRTLVNEVLPSGAYRVRWDGSDSNGHEVASGVYLYRLTVGQYMSTRKLVVLR
jgi:hypothetical protein